MAHSTIQLLEVPEQGRCADRSNTRFAPMDEMPTVVTADEAQIVAELLATHGRATARAYRQSLELLATFLATRESSLCRASRRELGLWIRALAEAGYAPATILRHLAAVSSFYAMCLADGVVTRSPAVGLRRPATDETPRLGLEATELAALISVARASCPDDELLVVLLGCLGLRISEVLGIDAEHLSRRGPSLAVTVTRKGGRREVVGIPGPLAELIEAACTRRPSGPLLVGARGRRLSAQVARRRLDRLGRDAGIAHLRPHTLRHSFVTLSLEANVSLPIVSVAAGHRDVRTTMSYAHALEARRAEAAEAILWSVTAARLTPDRCLTQGTAHAQNGGER